MTNFTFFTEREIETRHMLVGQFVNTLKQTLSVVNNAFRFIRIETTDADIPDGIITASKELLAQGAAIKHRLPLVIWQTGKSNKPRFENNQLEVQVLFSKTTATDYLPIIKGGCEEMLAMCGPIIADPNADVYQSINTGETMVVVKEHLDCWAGKSIEVTADMDACLRAFQEHQSYGRSVLVNRR